ncbi:lysosome-associated membrane glycoprotein 1-like isoform X2 [Vespa mandarinia]|uniref:lysosome-associated membrane glycoprotein 1-like isoform X2 n=1 Tax=Vespa mandarinia TaxID=7446 RepID=UPI00161A7C67|nr:lysosome-associated membrane glycoprotein 1-like isoform X2 [Vespa mandarinia]
MKLRFLYAILLMAIVMIKAEDDVDTDNILDNKDFGDIVNKENSGNRGRSLNVDVKNNEGEISEPGTGEETPDPGTGEETPDPGTGEETPDPGTGEETPDPGTGEETPDPGTGEETTDPGTGEETPDPGTGEETTDPGTGEETTDPGTGEETPDPGTGEETTDPGTGEKTPNPGTGGQTNSTESNTESTSDISTTSPSLKDYPYQVRGEKGTCILSKMTISLTVNYNITNKQIVSAILEVPSTVKVNGTCENDTNSMILTWTPLENDPESVNFADTTNNNNMGFYFKKSGSTFSLNQINASIYLDEKSFPNATDNGNYINLETTSDLNLFSSATDNRYVCNVNTVVKEDEFEISITNVSLIAFNEDDKTISSKSINDCTNDGATAAESANVGAIVGGIIGALVVVGIIGFIIWRRRRNSSSVRSEVA